MGLCLSSPEPKHNPSVIFVSLCLRLCSVGGLILDKTVSDPNFAGMAVFTPVINGEVLASAPGEQRGAGEEGVGGTASGFRRARVSRSESSRL